MTVEEYLQSEEAVRDVAALLAQPDPKFKGTTDGDGVFYLERGEAGAWRTVELDQIRGGANVEVYYRPEDDRFVIEALCAGASGVPAAELPRALCRVMLAAYRVAALGGP